MKIGILVSSFGNFGKLGYYNSQEIGLARALDGYCDSVRVYKIVQSSENSTRTSISQTKHAYLTTIPARHVGINGIFSVQQIDSDLDALVYFSDTQMMLSPVAKWARQNHVSLIPYIGVLKSSSTHMITRNIMWLLAQQNLRIYRTLPCLAKNTTIQESLQRNGVHDLQLSPVGIDTVGLHPIATESELTEFRKSLGFTDNNIPILFVGRMTEEKRPMAMLHIFRELLRINSQYRLIMVGEGALSMQVATEIRKQNLLDSVVRIDRFPNNEMWKLYSLSKVLVNLNKHEIFGMTLLESLFYNCQVVAIHAPGPDNIIQSSNEGTLVDNDLAIIEEIANVRHVAPDTQRYVQTNFSWDTVAKQVMNTISKNQD